MLEIILNISLHHPKVTIFCLDMMSQHKIETK